MTRIRLVNSDLSGLKILKRIPLIDERGWLERIYSLKELELDSLEYKITQVNWTLTRLEGTVRGMHLQLPPDADCKIVTCLKGKVWDVAVDLRRHSSTFLRNHTQILNGDQHESIMIPKGFAHGFQTLSSDCIMLYLHTSEFSPKNEMGVNALDPLLEINWPIPVAQRSPRDISHPLLSSDFSGFDF